MSSARLEGMIMRIAGQESFRTSDVTEMFHHEDELHTSEVSEGSKRMLNEGEAYELLKGYGVPIPNFAVAMDLEEAVKHAKRIGYPVVLKVISPQVVHKSDAGGVETGIADPEALEAAYLRIEENVKKRVQNAEILGMMIEEQLNPGVELLIGGKTDPTFGKVITFGLGGRLVELLRDVKIRILPLSVADIDSMIKGIRSYKLISGYRGEKPKDEKELRHILGRICRMFEERPELVEFDINPLILYEKGACAVDARFYVDEEAEAIRLPQKLPFSPSIFSPMSIAVVGASNDSHKIGYSVLRNLMSFPGKLYPVNSKKGKILGMQAFASISEIPEEVDMVVIAVPSANVPLIMEEAGKRGVKLAVIISAGFREIGAEGQERENRLTEIANEYGIRIVGPNCLGIILPFKKINATFDPASTRPGRLAFISQSGAAISTVVDWSIKEEIGFSSVISVGNQVDLGFDDFLRLASEDADTESIILYIEQIKDGKQFMKTVKEITPKKPIVAIKSGASVIGQKAASSHTGSLSGSYDVYQAAFEQTNVISSHSLTEAFQIGELLASEGHPKGKRAIVITNAGGFAVLSSDYAEMYGIDIVDLPAGTITELNSLLTEEWSHENPMDIVGDADVNRYSQVFDKMIEHQEEWDIAFVICVPTASIDPRHLTLEISRFSRNSHKMVVGCLLGGDSVRAGVHALRDHGIPNFSELEEAFRAVGKSVKPIRWPGIPPEKLEKNGQ